MTTFNFDRFDANVNQPHHDFIHNLGKVEMEWYQSFRTYVTDLIDPEVFQILFAKGVVSLLPIRALVALDLVQKAFGWSDQQALREARTDLCLRHALGITKSDDVPAIEAVERFRSLIDEYNNRTGIDLRSLILNTVIMPGHPVMKLGRDHILIYATQVA